MMRLWRILFPVLFTSTFLASACSVAKPATPPPNKQPLLATRMGKICTFPIQLTVFIKYNDTTFTTSPKRLKRLLSRLEGITKANCVFTIAEIHGHTNTEGDADANMELSRKRAVVVQEWLGQQGYWADTAEIIAHGENDLFIQTGDGVRKTINDRVNVLITGISTPPNTDPNRPPYDCLICMEKQGYPIPPPKN